MDNTAVEKLIAKYHVPCLVNKLPDLVGGGYGKFWKCRRRYLVVKGSRGSKKSRTTALRFIYNLMKYPDSNLLVIRQCFNTHKDSTYAVLKWAVNRFNVGHLWKFSKTPLEARYVPTGQKILFRGMDDPESLSSITVDTGALCWVWIEEAFQLTSETAFNKLDLSIRGELPSGLWKQIVFTFNPWSAKHWLKRRFFDTPSPDVLALTTNWQCNEWLDEADRKIFLDMEKTSPKRYEIEGKGEWGISEGLVYTKVRQEFFDPEEVKRRINIDGTAQYSLRYGLDFGFSNSFTALIGLLVSPKLKKIYIFYEHYQRAMTNPMIAAVIRREGLQKVRIYADSAEPKSIQEIRNEGIYNIHGCKKGGDLKRAVIQEIQGYEIIVHPKCVNTIIELSNYCWQVSTDDKILNEPIKEFDHAMDAMRYAVEGIGKNNFEFV